MFINLNELKRKNKAKPIPRGHFGVNLFKSILLGYSYSDPVNFSLGSFYFYIADQFKSGKITKEIVEKYFSPLYNFINIENPNSSFLYRNIQERWNEVMKKTHPKAEEDYLKVLALPDLYVYKKEKLAWYQCYLQKVYENTLENPKGCAFGKGYFNHLIRKAWKIHCMLNIADDISLLSTCRGTPVGAIMTDENFSIISSGYNGVPSGNEFIHCDLIDKIEEHDQSMELHAEANCFAHAHGNCSKSYLFCSHLPCWECAKTIIANLPRFNTKVIFTRNIYSSTQINSHSAEEVVTFLGKANIDVAILPTF